MSTVGMCGECDVNWRFEAEEGKEVYNGVYSPPRDEDMRVFEGI